MKDRRVVLTGLGVITPVGNDVDTFWSNLKNGVSGIERIQAFDTTDYDCRIGGEVRNFEPKDFFKNPKDARRTDRFTQLAMAAAKMAWTDSGVDVEKINRERFGVIVSSGIGGLKTSRTSTATFLARPLAPSLSRSRRLISNRGVADLDGIRVARPESLHRHSVRDLEQRYR